MILLDPQSSLAATTIFSLKPACTELAAVLSPVVPCFFCQLILRQSMKQIPQDIPSLIVVVRRRQAFFQNVIDATSAPLTLKPLILLKGDKRVDNFNLTVCLVNEVFLKLYAIREFGLTHRLRIAANTVVGFQQLRGSKLLVATNQIKQRPNLVLLRQESRYPRHGIFFKFGRQLFPRGWRNNFAAPVFGGPCIRNNVSRRQGYKVIVGLLRVHLDSQLASNDAE